MNDKEDSIKDIKFEELVFFLDTHTNSIYPLTDKEKMFEAEFLHEPSRHQWGMYKGELLHRAKLYKLPYKIKLITGEDKYSPDVKVEILYSGT